MWRTVPVVAALLASAGRIALADGTLDPNFGTGGIVQTVFTGPGGLENGFGSAGALQPDGKIVVTGAVHLAGGEIGLVRYEPDGTLDASFGTSGRVLTVLGGEQADATGIAVQADGKIVVVGWTWEWPTPRRMFVARYLSNGALDPGFGTAGVVKPTLAGDASGYAVMFGAGDTIVMGGVSGTGPRLMTVVRLLNDGTPDASFGTGGVATIDPSGSGLGGWLTDLVIQPDGKVVVTGSAASGSNSRMAVARLTASGNPDGTFGIGGVVRPDIGPSYGANAIALQSDGGIVVAGDGTIPPSVRMVLLRFSGTDGALDGTFGVGGIATLNANQGGFARALVVQEDGKIVVAGSDFLDFQLARFTAQGVLDSSFGVDGVVVTSVGTFATDEIHEVLIPFPGALLAVGWGTREPSKEVFYPCIALARYSATTPVTIESFSVE